MVGPAQKKAPHYFHQALKHFHLLLSTTVPITWQLELKLKLDRFGLWLQLVRACVRVSVCV